jgi:hypothetical protein
MTRWFALVLFSSLLTLRLTLSLPAFGQDVQGGGSNQPTTQSLQGTDAHASLHDCAPPDSKSKTGPGPLIYPASKASYVGGTVREMLRGVGLGHRLEQFVLFEPRQFRRDGQIALSSGCLLFAFNKDGFEPSREVDANYRIFECSNKAKLSDEDNACQPVTSEKPLKSYVIAIPYAKVNLLSRAKYPASDLGSFTTAYATVAGAVIGGLLSNNKNWSVVGGVAGGLAIYYAVAIHARKQDNYIAVFLEPPMPRFDFSRVNSTVTVRSPTTHYLHRGQQVQISDVANSPLTGISQICRDDKGKVTVTVRDASHLPPIGSQVQIIHASDPGFEGKFQVTGADAASKTFTYEQKDKLDAASLKDTGKDVGEVQDVWNGTFVVEKADSLTFTYEQPGPDDSVLNTPGTIGPADVSSTNVAVTGTLARSHPATANPKSVDLTGTVAVTPPPAKSDELFKKGDLVMFRIPNHHDYYNISMTLSSGTGLTFVSETAEKPAK